MANQEHLEILYQGTDIWNRWREEHPQIIPDLSRLGHSDAPLLGERIHVRSLEFGGIDYMETNLSGYNFSKADLSESSLANTWNHKFYGSNFAKANLTNASLSSNKFNGTDFRHARLTGADLSYSSLSNADLSYSDLERVNFSNADLTSAHLLSADLTRALLLTVNLSDADLHNTKLNNTVFGDVDLSSIKGLETIEQKGPSYIDILSIYRSKGQIPEHFLRNAGIPHSFITYARSLVTSPIDYYTCFISYSSKDQDFAERLHADLRSHNVRCWFAPEDMKIGDRIRPRIDESIRLYDKLLLVLSEHSVLSKWVEFEVEAAMDKEQEGKPPVLFPVRLDNTVRESTTPWAAHIKRTRHIGDFTDWKKHDAYKKAFNRLLRDLKAEP